MSNIRANDVSVRKEQFKYTRAHEIEQQQPIS